MVIERTHHPQHPATDLYLPTSVLYHLYYNTQSSILHPLFFTPLNIHHPPFSILYSPCLSSTNRHHPPYSAVGVPITQPEEETNGSITVLDPVQEARASAAASMGVPLISLPKGK